MNADVTAVRGVVPPCVYPIGLPYDFFHPGRNENGKILPG